MKDVTPTADITFVPAKIEFNAEDFSENINELVAKYSAVDIENVDIKELKAIRTEMNKFYDAIERRRKDIKSEIAQPYDEFYSQYKGPVDKFLAIKSIFDDQIKKYDANQKKLRQDRVRSYIESSVDIVKEETGLDLAIEHFEVKGLFEQFSKAGDFKPGSLELTKKTKETLDAIVLSVVDDVQKQDEEEQLIRETCTRKGLVSNAYIRQYMTNRNLSEVLKQIDEDVEERNRIEAEKAQSKITKQYNADTGEIIEDEINIHERKKNSSEGLSVSYSDIYTATLKLTFTMEQAKGFRKYLDDNNIQFETIREMEKVND